MLRAARLAANLVLVRNFDQLQAIAGLICCEHIFHVVTKETFGVRRARHHNGTTIGIPGRNSNRSVIAHAIFCDNYLSVA